MVVEGDVFVVCANFVSLPLQRNVSADFIIPESKNACALTTYCESNIKTNKIVMRIWQQIL